MECLDYDYKILKRLIMYDIENNENKSLYTRITKKEELNMLELFDKIKLYIYVQGVNLDTIKGSFWDLNIEGLDISFNKLEYISFSIGKLNLKKLYIGNNPLKLFPKKICDLQNLEALYMNDCSLTIIPDSISNLINLQELDIGRNYLIFFPLIVCELKNLKKLWVNGNCLSSLPDSIKNLKLLEMLDISDNNFTTFPNIVFDLNLKFLNIKNNKFEKILNIL